MGIKFFAIIEETFREARARKTLIAFFIVSTVIILFALLLFQMDSVRNGLLHPPKEMHKSVNGKVTTQTFAQLGYTVLDMVWTAISIMLMIGSVLVGVFATSSFITSLMEKGTIDLLISKPVARWQYIVGRYIGAVVIIFLEVSYLIVALWLIAGLSLGVWNSRFLMSIFYITLAYAGIYSIVVLIGVLTRSNAFAMIIGLLWFFIAGLLIPLGHWFDQLLNGESNEGVFTTVTTVIHYIVPQVNDLSSNMKNYILNRDVTFAPVLATMGITLAYVLLSSFAFSKKEF